MVNTAATAMIIPIVMAIINELRVSKNQVKTDDSRSNELAGIENSAFEKDSNMLELQATARPSDNDDQASEVVVAIIEGVETQPEEISNEEITDFERGIILSVPYSCSIGIRFNAFELQL